MLGSAQAMGGTSRPAQIDYVNMPNAVLDADRTFSGGFDAPDGTLWASSAILPFHRASVSLGARPIHEEGCAFGCMQGARAFGDAIATLRRSSIVQKPEFA